MSINRITEHMTDLDSTSSAAASEQHFNVMAQMNRIRINLQASKNVETDHGYSRFKLLVGCHPHRSRKYGNGKYGDVNDHIASAVDDVFVCQPFVAGQNSRDLLRRRT